MNETLKSDQVLEAHRKNREALEAAGVRTPVDMLQLLGGGRTRDFRFSSMDGFQWDLMTKFVGSWRADEARIFRFRDPNLAQSIAETDIRTFDPDMFRMPFQDILIELPKTSRLEDLGEIDPPSLLPIEDVEEWDVLQVKDLSPTFEGTPVEVVGAPLFGSFYNTAKKSMYWITFDIGDFKGVRNGRAIISNERREATPGISIAFLSIVKFISFLTSSNVEYVQRAREMKRKGKYAFKQRPPYMEIRFKHTYRVSSESAGTGTKHSYRYSVRGHFKKFTKGPMSGRHIWCPPHHRGPEQADLVGRRYVVEK